MKSCFIQFAVLLISAGTACLTLDADSSATESALLTANVLTRNEINAGDTAWMLISCGLVILMVKHTSGVGGEIRS